MTATEVLAEFEAAQALLHGHFVLSSGRHSSIYLQCARVMMSPARGEKLCAALAEKLRVEGGEIDVVVSPAMGGVIVGYEVARQLGVDALFAERVDGQFQLRRGFVLAPGARVLMVEDVVTTGKSSRECIESIKQAGGRPVAAASLIDRGGADLDLGVPLISLARINVPSYPEEDLPAELADLPIEKPGSRFLQR